MINIYLYSSDATTINVSNKSNPRNSLCASTHGDRLQREIAHTLFLYLLHIYTHTLGSGVLGEQNHKLHMHQCAERTRRMCDAQQIESDPR